MFGKKARRLLDRKERRKEGGTKFHFPYIDGNFQIYCSLVIYFLKQVYPRREYSAFQNRV